MPLDRLAPDQRAVVQLVLQQGRSYDDLATLLGISGDAVRARAHAGVAALTDAPAPAGAGELADFLLGQQDEAARAATEHRLASDATAREWALLTAGELADVAGDRLPAIPAPAADAGAPAAAGPAAGEPETQPAAEGLGRPRPRPRPLRDAAPAAAGPGAAERAATVADRPAAGDRRSSRLGGALLIGGLAIVVAAVLVLVLGGDDDGDPTATGDTTTAEATPTATATPQALGQIPLQAVEGQTGRGVLALYGQAGQGIVFTLAAERVPALDEGEAYAMWLTKDAGSDAQLLGFFQEAPQGRRRQLATSGPRESDQEAFAGWLTEYDNIVVSKETVNRPQKPTTIVISGDLPQSGGGEE